MVIAFPLSLPVKTSTPMSLVLPLSLSLSLCQISADYSHFVPRARKEIQMGAIVVSFLFFNGIAYLFVCVCLCALLPDHGIRATKN